MSQKKPQKTGAERRDKGQGPKYDYPPNGGPGRLASSGAFDDTVDPHDSGGRFDPIDPNHIAPE